MLALGDIDSYDQMSIRTPNLTLELTEALDPAKVIVVHDNLLLAVGFCFGCLYAIRRLFFYKAIITFLFTTLGGIFYNYFNI